MAGHGPASLSARRASTLQVEFAQATDAGRVRDHNEDSFGYFVPETAEQARSHGWLFVLADGVGGHEDGEVASRAAVDALLAGFPKAAGGEPHAPLLTRLAQAANTRIYEAGTGMATTLVACALRYDRATVAHVGDSRCYLIRRGHAVALTRDHTVAGEQARLGLITARAAAKAETKHILSRSLGGDLFVAVETSEHHVMTGDVLLLCSDGLHGSVSGSDMAGIADQGELPARARELVALAKARDGSDNISVQLIRVHGTEPVGMYRGRPYKLR